MNKTQNQSTASSVWRRWGCFRKRRRDIIHFSTIQGGLEKVSLIIIAITLLTASWLS